MHKFKLKKDGEIVGYLWIAGKQYPSTGEPMFAGIRFRHPDRENWSEVPIAFDAAHPFVCKERLFGLKGEGQDIFAGDRVKRLLNEVGGIDKHGNIIDGLCTDEIELIKEKD